MDELYAPTVEACRLGALLEALNPVLKELVRRSLPGVRDAAVRALLGATLAAWRRALLDGGPSRAFSVLDAAALEEDLSQLEDFFEADGDGLPRGVVAAACRPAQQLMSLFGLDTVSGPPHWLMGISSELSAPAHFKQLFSQASTKMSAQ